MTKLLKQIQKAVYSGLKGRFTKGTFHTVQASEKTDLDDHGDTNSTKVTSYTFEGFEDEYDEHPRPGAGVPENVYKIQILGPSLAVTPFPGCEILLDGKYSSVLKVTKDPAQAMWTCQCFEIKEFTIGC